MDDDAVRELLKIERARETRRRRRNIVLLVLVPILIVGGLIGWNVYQDHREQQEANCRAMSVVFGNDPSDC